MSVDKLVDSTQLDADLTSVANAIRTKGGTSAQLAFPAGFVSAVQAIPSGGGDSGEVDSDYVTVKYAIVTVGTNTVSNGSQIVEYLQGLAGFASGYNDSFFSTVDHGSTWVTNNAVCSDLANQPYPRSTAKFYRYRNGAMGSVQYGSSYDAKLTSGDKYLIVCAYLKGAPTV